MSKPIARDTEPLHRAVSPRSKERTENQCPAVQPRSLTRRPDTHGLRRRDDIAGDERLSALPAV